jgi:hypothetical protein
LSVWVIAIAGVAFALTSRTRSAIGALDLLLVVAIAARLLFIVAVFLGTFHSASTCGSAS